MRTGPPEFAIFDAFGGEAGRDAHLADQVAAVLMTHAAEPLAEPPTIAKVENIADKLPLGEPTPGAAWR